MMLLFTSHTFLSVFTQIAVVSLSTFFSLVLFLGQRRNRYLVTIKSPSLTFAFLLLYGAFGTTFYQILIYFHPHGSSLVHISYGVFGVFAYALIYPKLLAELSKRIEFQKAVDDHSAGFSDCTVLAKLSVFPTLYLVLFGLSLAAIEDRATTAAIVLLLGLIAHHASTTI